MHLESRSIRVAVGTWVAASAVDESLYGPVINGHACGYHR